MRDLVQLATLGVATDVEREGDFGGELATLFKHGIDGVHIQVSMLGNLLEIINDLEQFVHHKLHIAQRRGIGRHAYFSLECGFDLGARAVSAATVLP